MKTPTTRWIAVALSVAALSASALTVSASASTPSVPGLTSKTVDLGAIVTQSGPAAADFGAYIDGVNAYIHYVDTTLKGVNGRNLVMADDLDDMSDPTTDTTDARQLVTQDHVFGIVGVATAFFQGESYLATSGVPTFGYATTNVWSGPKNLFADYGSVINYSSSLPDFAYVAKQVKATKIAVLAYDYPSSDAECQPAVSELKNFGFDVVYDNMNEPLIFANFSSDVTKMASDHVNMVISCMQASDSVSLTKLMMEQGMGAIPQVWLDGYDRTTLKNNAKYMQNVYLLIQHAPFEAYTAYPKVFPGLGLYEKQMLAYFKFAYPTTYAKYESAVYDDVALMGWESANLFTEGLRAAGKSPTQASVIAAINKITKDEGGPTGEAVTGPTNWTIAHTKNTSPSCIAFVTTQNTSNASKASFKLAFNKGSDPWVCFPLDRCEHQQARSTAGGNTRRLNLLRERIFQLRAAGDTERLHVRARGRGTGPHVSRDGHLQLRLRGGSVRRGSYLRRPVRQRHPARAGGRRIVVLIVAPLFGALLDVAFFSRIPREESDGSHCGVPRRHGVLARDCRDADEQRQHLLSSASLFPASTGITAGTGSSSRPRRCRRSSARLWCWFCSCSCCARGGWVCRSAPPSRARNFSN